MFDTNMTEALIKNQCLDEKMQLDVARFRKMLERKKIDIDVFN